MSHEAIFVLYVILASFSHIILALQTTATNLPILPFCTNKTDDISNQKFAIFKGRQQIEEDEPVGEIFDVLHSKCPNSAYELEPEDQRAYLQRNGSVLVVTTQPFGREETEILQSQAYCIYQPEAEDAGENETSADNPDMKICPNCMVLVCFSETDESVSGVSLWKRIGMCISIPFLVLTLLVYIILPDRNVPARILMSFVSSLIMAYGTLIVINSNIQWSKSTCISSAIVCYYFFMASILWMTISCVDIYLTFSGYNGYHGDKRREMRRFVIYLATAFGVPLAMSLLVLGLNFHQAVEKPHFYHPMIGEGSCWLKEGYPTFMYFYSPMTAMIVTNIVLFALTAYKIKKICKETAILKRANSRRHNADEKERFNLYVKLLFAMGVNFTMEIISSLVDTFSGNQNEYFWIVTDLCNALYGVCIFFIFAFKRKTFDYFAKRYNHYSKKYSITASTTEGETMLNTTTESTNFGSGVHRQKSELQKSVHNC